jgi:two-component system nitrogen regulation response regulator GlnG
MPQAILVVDDDAAACWALEEALRSHGHVVVGANSAAAALRHLKKALPALVITDVRMPGGSGLDLLAELKRDHPALPVVVTTAYGSVETASTAIARGAFDFLPKPLDLDRALAVVERALGRRAVALEVAPGQAGEPVLVGAAPVMQEVFRRIALAAASDLPVLITGPTGSGKELAARLVHRHSAHAAGPFVAVNCGALPEDFAEGELFGVAPGTLGGHGAPGLFATADGGTLLLDEVDALPPAVQSKLLRVLEDRQVRAVGASAPQPMAVHVIATTCRELGEIQGFRPDLVHRLTVMTLAMPALADHPGDLPLVTAHLLTRLATRINRPLALTETALDRLVTHTWPGNVRELKHVLDEAAAVAPGGVIDAEHLRLPQADEAPPAAGADLRLRAEVVLDQAPGKAYAQWIDTVEAPLFAAALARTRGNQLRAAELLGIHRTTLRKRTHELGLSSGREEPGDG